MKRQSLHKPLCMCCKFLRCEKKNNVFCKNCSIFIYKRLGLKSEYVSKILNNLDYSHVRMRVKNKCSLCGDVAVISHGDYNANRKYFLCQAHYDRWMKIGHELSSFINNFLDD